MVATTLSAVISLVPAHLRFLDSLLSNLLSSTHPFSEVIIVASGFGRRVRSLESISGRLPFENMKLVQCSLQSAGANRNLGWKHATAELVAFLDADDLYHPLRNSIAAKSFQNQQFDLFLNSFVPFQTEGEVQRHLNSDPRGSEQTFSSIDFFHGTLVERARDRVAEISGTATSTVLEFTNKQATFPIHHAHAIVRNTLKKDFRFHEIFGMRNEDSIFVRDILESGADIVVSAQQLSFYRQGFRAKPKKRLSTFRSRIGNS